MYTHTHKNIHKVTKEEKRAFNMKVLAASGIYIYNSLAIHKRKSAYTAGDEVMHLH